MPKKKFTKKHKPPQAPSLGTERFVQWLCQPGQECVPLEKKPFTEEVQWRIFRIMAEFIEGFEFLSKLKNEVTIFGSARAKSSSWEYKEARKLGKMLATKGYTVITGGGPGIMEASNRGASEGKGESIGLDIELPKGQRRNPYVTQAIGFHYFFTRKVMLSASAQAYVFFPGGFGTLDEMSEMLTLIQTQKIPAEVPLILVGTHYWLPFLDWVDKIIVRKYKFADKKEAAIMRLVDSAEEAFKIIQQTTERRFG